MSLWLYCRVRGVCRGARGAPVIRGTRVPGGRYSVFADSRQKTRAADPGVRDSAALEGADLTSRQVLFLQDGYPLFPAKPAMVMPLARCDSCFCACSQAAA